MPRKFNYYSFVNDAEKRSGFGKEMGTMSNKANTSGFAGNTALGGVVANLLGLLLGLLLIIPPGIRGRVVQPV